MLWPYVVEQVRTRLLDDTGTGGLRASSDPLIADGAVYQWGLWDEAPAYPYITLQQIDGVFDEVFNADATAGTVTFQVDVWSHRNGEDADANHNARAERVMERLRRWQMPGGTIAGATWQGSAVFPERTINELAVEGTAMRTTYDFNVSLSRVAT